MGDARGQPGGGLRHGPTLHAASGRASWPKAVPPCVRVRLEPLYATAVRTPPPGRFLGTESFPEEGAFKAFLQKHGGSSNAFTGMETTGFHFVLQESALRPALKHFSSFFTVSTK